MNKRTTNTRTTNKRAIMSRRTLLRGAIGSVGSVSIGLPALDIMCNGNGTAWADGLPFPKRFLIYFWGNGNEPEAWTPAGVGRDWVPNFYLSSLTPLKDKVSIVTGTQLPIARRYNPHVEGAVGIMGAANPLLHESYKGSKDWDFMTHPGPTIDRVVAASLGKQTPFSSLELGATPAHPSFGPGQAVSFPSHNGPFSPNPYAFKALEVFTRLFGPNFRDTNSPPDPMLRVRTSVLDAVALDAKALQQRLGMGDRMRLEQHLDGIRALELAILRPASMATSICAKPPIPKGGTPWPGEYADNARIMGQLMVMAVACDLARVGTFVLTSPASHANIAANIFPADFPFACNGAKGVSFHEFEHCSGFIEPVRLVLRFMIERYAEFIGLLDSVPEGDGTLLDHSVVWGTSEVANGWNHKHDNFPMLVAGSAGGALKTGLHLPLSGDAATINATRVPFSLLRALGMPIQSWGRDQFQTSNPISELLA